MKLFKWLELTEYEKDVMTKIAIYLALFAVIALDILMIWNLIAFWPIVISIPVIAMLGLILDDDSRFGFGDYLIYVFVLILFIGTILALFRYHYIERNLNKNVTNQQKVENVQFFDDTKTVAYVASPSGQFSSEVLGGEYFENKAKFLEIGNCYLVSYNKKYQDIYETNSTEFECY
jgi:hypothetical protein